MEGHDYMVARMLLSCGSELWFVEMEKEVRASIVFTMKWWWCYRTIVWWKEK